MTLTGEKTLRHFWQESPRSILYLADRIQKKHRPSAEAPLVAEAGESGEIEE